MKFITKAFKVTCVSLAVLFGLSLVVASIGVSNDSKERRIKIVNNQPEVVINASTLFDHYHANEIRADREYKNKVLEITGTVSGLDKGPSEAFT